MDFLTRIRSKPPLVRTQYALIAAAVLTGLVALIWLTTLPARFADIGDDGDERAEEKRPDENSSAPVEEPPSIPAPALEGLDLSPSTPTTTSLPAATQGTTSASRNIQIGTTSQIAE